MKKLEYLKKLFRRPALPPSGETEDLIRLENLVKIYDTGALKVMGLKKINLTIRRGEFVAIMGQSGSGKSTLMNILGCLDRPTLGHYYLDGQDTAQMTSEELSAIRNQKIGFVFQNFNLISRTNAQKNVELPMMYAGVPAGKRSARAKELLEMVGMGNRLTHQPSELSGGQKQRVAIARAMANDPAIILADEPTGALDSKTGRLVMDLFHQLNREQGKTIVLITHNQELALETDRFVTMRDGRLYVGDTGEEVRYGDR